MDFRDGTTTPPPTKKASNIIQIHQTKRPRKVITLITVITPSPPTLPRVLQVIQIPDHDITILGACEEHIPHATKALDKAVVPCQDMDAMPW